MFPIAHSLRPFYPHPLVPSTCRRMRAFTAISAKPRHNSGRSRRTRSWDDEDDDDNIDNSFFGESQEGEAEVEEAPAPEEEQGRVASQAGPARQLRGSDVLRAMQRAVAAKEAKKRKKAGTRPAARREERKQGDDKVTGEVKAIEIRSEWAPKIRELEIRLRQLAEKYHHHQ